MSIALTDLAEPIIAAPMASGPSTPALVEAVSRGGGLGMLAAGYKKPEGVRDEIAAVRSRTDAPFGVNLFVPEPHGGQLPDLTTFSEHLRIAADRRHTQLGPTDVDGDDHFSAKLDLVCALRVPVVSFTFGTPPPAALDAVHEAGGTVLMTVTTPDEAVAAQAAGADALVVQGFEAGGHRGDAGDTEADDYGLLALLRLTAKLTDLPLVAAGGLVDGAGIAGALTAGATAVQLGTAFLRCPEAGMNVVHRAAVGSSRQTTVTRAFTGRRARALVNDFTTRYAEMDIPHAYPGIHHLTAPLRSKAPADGDPEELHMWAAQAHQLTEPLSATELVSRLGAQARQAIAEATLRLGSQREGRSSPTAQP